MALREIRKYEDELLRKKSRTVEEVDDRIRLLIDDMAETMYKADGVGLAAPQVGVLRRVIVVDAGSGLIALVNPEIVASEGEQIGVEGCLSIPDVAGEVARPKILTVRGLNRDGELIEITGEDLLARALSHEIDHLDGVLFIDRVIRYVDAEEEGGIKE
ncbi:peptide deformylase [Calorimonas adulescens]|jgi:peptide deformylase (EC 3.5.1.88)|uniref:Peptide deformylase n=1 Tax=Calorimonas adulescens TaxID=2606906 RepID=A0A5D8QFU2_9THEO|nr:peptide deformylase [Calorimonas adulescens]TZE83415.1 peptide deformylase [Calorimonas adulescens]